MRFIEVQIGKKFYSVADRRWFTKVSETEAAGGFYMERITFDMNAPVEIAANADYL